MTPDGATRARKTVTVLFCDLTGSTALGERLDPETLREVIGRYFDEMRAVIERHGGTVEKFIGDAVMAVFGVPRVHEDDALRAVRAAADMQAALAEANVGFERDFGTRIEARIGVHTGEVIAGDPTTEESFVSGDAVNVAARLEQAADPGEVLFGESTYRLVRAAVIAEPLEPLALKGKSQPVAAYRLVVVESGSEMLPRRLDAPLVGRNRELALLRSAFDESVSASQCRLVTLTGEAGLGKSRLALELLTSVEGSALVLRGRCLPYGEGITFWPITEILEAAAGIESTEGRDEARAKVERLLPPDQLALGRRLAALMGAAGPGGAIQETFLAVRRLLEHLASERPVAVVFDDIQWGEEAFLDLVQYLATFSVTRPVFVLCLARPELSEIRPDWTQLGASIRLEPLASAASEAMVTNLLGRVRMPEEIATTIVSAAGGNPLFIEEMLRMMVDKGAIERRNGGWAVSGDLEAVGAPETVHAVIAARLDGLAPAEREVLQHASVVGEVFWWGAVADLTQDQTPTEVGRLLSALVRKDLIRPDASSFFGEDAFRFGHLLIRDVAYESLPKKTRATVHERFAEWVAGRAGERSAEFDEIIGYHAERAYRFLSELSPTAEKTLELALMAAARLSAAGERALSRGDVSAASNLLGRAVALLPANEKRLPELQWKWAEALGESGKLDEAVSAFDDAIAGARAAGHEAFALRTEMRRLRVAMHTTLEWSHEDALQIAERAKRSFEELGDEAGLAEALNVFEMVYVWAGRCEDAIRVGEQVAEIAQRLGDPALEAETMHWMGLAIEVGLMPIAEAIPKVERLAARFPDDRILLTQCRRHLGVMQAQRGRFAEGRRLLREGTDSMRELGMEVNLASGQLRNSAEVERLAGDLATAESMLREAVEILERIGDLGHLASVAPDLALLLLDAGGHDSEALRFAELGEANAIEDDVDAVVRVLSAKAIALSRLGHEEEAERLARDAARRAWATDYTGLRAISLEALAEVLHGAGRNEEGNEALEKSIGVYEAKGDIVSAAAARRVLAERRAAAASS